MEGSKKGRRLGGRLLAEFAVIVVGVWIALWGDGWASDRRDRALERVRLQALVENVQLLRTNLAAEAEDVGGAGDALRALIAGPRDDPAAIEAHFAYGLFYVSMVYARSSVYDDLKNSGELALLTDPALREALSEMEALLEGLQGAQRDMATVQQLTVDPFLIGHFNLYPVLSSFLDLSESGESSGVVDVLDSDEFRNQVLFKLDLTTQVGAALARVQNQLDHVEQLIRAQL